MTLPDCTFGVYLPSHPRTKRISISLLLLFLLSLSGLLAAQPQTHAKAAARQVKIGEAEARTHLIDGDKPQYPKAALIKELQGTVVLQAVVGKDGSFEKLKIVSRDPKLAQALVSTVRQSWKYKPFIVNGKPVEVAFPIEYVFKLD